MALLNQRLSDQGAGLIFQASIPKPNNLELINSILSELKVMKIGNFVNEDIHLTTNETLNAKIRQALDIVITLAQSNEHFTNDTIQGNFIAKLMIWSNHYLEGLNFTTDTIPKCVFYGPIKRHEVYFLLLLALIGVDVLYFNPTGDPTFKAVLKDNSVQELPLGPCTSSLIPYIERVEKGDVIDKVTTYARQATNELEQTLYNDTGIYKPWQFADGITRPVIMDSVIEDTLTYWNEPARLRPGFKTAHKTVYTPIFFSKISGAYRDINEYYQLVEKLRSAKKCCFYESPHLTNVGYGQTRNIQYHNMPSGVSTHAAPNYNQQDLYSLAFCLNPDKTIKREDIKKHVLYKKILSLRVEVQDFILNKLEETFASSNLSLFNFQVTDKERLRLMAAIFTAEDQLLNIIEGYDFTEEVPKVIMYVNSREPFLTDDAMLLGLLRQMGLDIILLSPNGANNLELVIGEKFINQIKLEEFIPDLPLKTPSKKGSFFSKLFR